MSEPDWQEVARQRKLGRERAKVFGPAPSVRLKWAKGDDVERFEAIKLWCETNFKCANLTASGRRYALLVPPHVHSVTGATFFGKDRYAAHLGCDPKRLAEGRADLLLNGLLQAEDGYPPDKDGLPDPTRRKTKLFYLSIPVLREAYGTPPTVVMDRADRPHPSAGVRSQHPCDLSKVEGPHPQPADGQPHIKEVSKTQGLPSKALGVDGSITLTPLDDPEDTAFEIPTARPVTAVEVERQEPAPPDDGRDLARLLEADGIARIALLKAHRPDVWSAYLRQFRAAGSRIGSVPDARAYIDRIIDSNRVKHERRA